MSNNLQHPPSSLGDKGDALSWYLDGVDELQKGIAISPVGSSPEDKAKISKLQAKMLNNLEMCRGRISDLSKLNTSKVEYFVYS